MPSAALSTNIPFITPSVASIHHESIKGGAASRCETGRAYQVQPSLAQLTQVELGGPTLGHCRVAVKEGHTT